MTAAVLITDSNQRKALAAARALGARGNRIIAAETVQPSLCSFSRHVQTAVRSPPPAAKARFASWLMGIGPTHRIDVLLPTDDETTATAVAEQRHLPYKVLVPTPDQFRIGRDKGLTMVAAQKTGVPHPDTIRVHSETEAVMAAHRLGWPVVFKARFASGGRGLYFVQNAAEARKAWRRQRQEWGGFIVQRRVPLGRKFDVCLLFGPTGTLTAAFVQEELRWFPGEHGTSTLQESATRPELIALTRRLLAPTGWVGLVEAEFMVNAAGEPFLLEVNPRLWASVALAIRCGVDFPAMAVRLALGEAVSPITEYAVGLRTRWLLPGDILHFLLGGRRSPQSPGFFRTFDWRTYDDIICKDDLGPVFGFGVNACRNLFNPVMWRMLMRW